MKSMILTNKYKESLQKICKLEIDFIFFNIVGYFTIDIKNGRLHSKYYKNKLEHILTCNILILNLLNSTNKNEVILGLNLLKNMN